ncbi:related to MTG1 Peripheral GTPase of the mitochondrial inner membrane, essential for respiratory competence [Rhynchosporium agropyri]|uniref:Related to MTG1 Peripheral GTPase of the mitochondrial inner membrane, essential for respiratory competence n=1 Tax=Rhynchosporium agropyri TaxID=914238 RepID=A0A1E1LPN1_9HELO|nr:related to MTG1 Peripheral GTPase of the mitochondrial inner membrane, essential for respiratory competence [Rhynchosporium agropyri]
MNALLSYIVDHASRTQSLLGSRVLVVGMPNVGKSALLNALRGAGMNNHTKAARTGAQPGITRKIATSVNIVPKDGRTGFEGVSLVDTPGVFVPFVPDGESMLKMTLVGSVKEKLIAPTLLCDYLLYQINRQPDGPKFYAKYCPPTNDVVEVLESVCRKTGMLGKGGEPDMDRAALWMMYRWRHGHLGAFILDDVVEDGLINKTNEEIGTSVSQARKLAKEAQRARGKARHAASIAV